MFIGIPTLSLDGARIYIVRTINCIAARRQLIRGIQDSRYRGSVGDSTNSNACLLHIIKINGEFKSKLVITGIVRFFATPSFLRRRQLHCTTHLLTTHPRRSCGCSSFRPPPPFVRWLSDFSDESHATPCLSTLAAVLHPK